MAAYPSYTIGLGSTQELESGWSNDIASSGSLHSRQFHSQQYYRWTLVHPGLTGTQYEALLATYAAAPRAEHTLTYRQESPQITYTVQFTAPPQIVSNYGGSKYDVIVQLRGTKD